ncbi:hypothetical protein BZG36_01927 [Bifiguratus adelaidae]|uniref:THO complex subunit 7 n=1 Tax=Bifiguratus adelaidae TaxID=1938954 RepID=A0A261Y4K7_9FUNG|nr:hypothetical protein BZG36_01927 [Bifiguratus adelaidae]
MDAEVYDEETSVKTRLSVDERPLRNLIKKFYSWVNQLDNVTNEEAQTSLDALFLQLLHYQILLKRQQALHDMNIQEVQNYSQENIRIEQESQEAKEAIVALQSELEKARKLRDNKMEYDKIAKDIMQLKTRKESLDTIQQLESDIKMLEKEKVTYKTLRQHREQQFYTLIGSVKALQKEIEEERERGNQAERMAMLINMEDGNESEDDIADTEEDNQDKSGLRTPRTPMNSQPDDNNSSGQPSANEHEPSTPSAPRRDSKHYSEMDDNDEDDNDSSQTPRA